MDKIIELLEREIDRIGKVVFDLCAAGLHDRASYRTREIRRFCHILELLKKKTE